MSKLPPAVTFRVTLILLTLLLAACGERPASRPAAPTGVKAEARAGFNLVSWEHDGKGASGFAVYRTQTSGLQAAAGLQELATLAADARQYEDRSVQAGASYRYAVAALGAGAASPHAGTDGDVVALEPPGFTAKLGQSSVNVYAGRNAAVELVVTPSAGYSGEVVFALAGEAASLLLAPGNSVISGGEPVRVILILTADADAAPGKRELQLLVTGEEAPDSILEFEAVVKALPQAGFVADPEAGTAPLLVEFDASGLGDKISEVARYEWNFGDEASGEANAAEGSTASHEFARSGSYEVQLTVWDEQGESATNTLVVVVENALPIAAFTVSENPVAGEPVTFDASSSVDPDGSIENFEWRFGEDDAASGEVVTHTFSKNGPHPVTLAVTDDEGARDVLEKTIEIGNATPAAAFTVSESPTAGQAVTFDASSSTDLEGDIKQYDWTFGDGDTAAGKLVTHTFGKAGPHTVTLTVTDEDDAIDVISIGVEVLPAPPQAAFTAVDLAAGLELFEVAFDASDSTDPDGTITTYSWDFGDGTVLADAGDVLTHTFPDFGLYEATLTVRDDDGHTDSVVHSVEVGFKNVVQVAAGTEFSLALLNDGSVWAWGSHRDGQLGNGDFDSYSMTETPARIPDLTNVVAIAAGRQHALALLDDGTVATWGDDIYGQLGIGEGVSEPPYRAQSIPVQVTGLPAAATAIAAGPWQSFAILEDGTLWAWGENEYGQVCAQAEDCYLPEQVAGLEGVVKGVEAGSRHIVALLDDGSVFTWGDNDYGMLGYEGDGSPVPAQVLAMEDVIWIAAGTLNTVAVRANGTVWAWGVNSYGILGNNDVGAYTHEPQQIDVQDVEEVAFTKGHLLALSRGEILSWGDGRGGQLGWPTESGVNPVPAPVSTLDHTVAGIGVGPDHSLAILEDGTLWTWGFNGRGQLGNGSPTGSGAINATPTRVTGWVSQD